MNIHEEEIDASNGRHRRSTNREKTKESDKDRSELRMSIFVETSESVITWLLVSMYIFKVNDGQFGCVLLGHYSFGK